MARHTTAACWSSCSETTPPPLPRSATHTTGNSSPFAAIAEVERDFLETARGAEQEIAGTENCDTIARAAHRLKGASGMIGAVALRQLAETLENAAKAFDLKTVRRLHGDLRREVERVVRQVGA